MWEKTQKHELAFWSQYNLNCSHTFVEDRKQLEVYAVRMKLTTLRPGSYILNMEGKSVVDIGSGPSSLLLKSVNFSHAYAVDPLMDQFPSWVKLRYLDRKIIPVTAKGEDVEIEKVDMAIIYNCLQHVQSPEKVIQNVKKLAKETKIFEWVDIPKDDKHIHILKADLLDKWLGKKGVTEKLNEPYTFSQGTCYYNHI